MGIAIKSYLLQKEQMFGLLHLLLFEKSPQTIFFTVNSHK
ncbi:hypothetical protein BGAPBR_Q0029 (plasmid) [Borreliella garinii PBr]|uniref:Uncharacterized protein n=1 Tax=Borreliella garinii PBr TaxID=498743 RepID=B8F1A7_BORGR|nr:hypothetical protein BGAPBR_Q0029 [Borreliella garinii PBr]